MKRFKILVNGLPHKIIPMIDDILYACCWATLFVEPRGGAAPPLGGDSGDESD